MKNLRKSFEKNHVGRLGILYGLISHIIRPVAKSFRALGQKLISNRYICNVFYKCVGEVKLLYNTL